MRSFENKKILVLVTGSIAAYKSAEVVSRLVQNGAEVITALSQTASEFIGSATFQGLTGRPVLTDIFDEPTEGIMAHIHFPQNVDAILVVPATANIIAHFANGIADDLISTMLLAATKPVIVAPAMNSAMFSHPATRENVAKLVRRGVIFVEPESGRLACGTVGEGRLASVEAILETVEETLFPLSDLVGKKILITCGAAREPIDPVRFISNRSSGKMGIALAEAATERGAEVHLILGHVETEVPDNISRTAVETTAQMAESVAKLANDFDNIIFAAAPADFAPIPKNLKIKRKTLGDKFEMTFHPTPDVIGAAKPFHKDKIFVGFAAETDNLERNALQKLADKGLDMIVANDVSEPGIGFGSDKNAVTIYASNGEVTELAIADKKFIAHQILDEVSKLLKQI